MDNIIYFIIGSVSLIAGLIIFFMSRKKNTTHSNQSLVISWLLIALFPVFLLFHFFPDSQSNATIFGFTFGGAIAAFIFIWRSGVKTSITAGKIDGLEAEIANLKKSISNTKAAIKPKVLTSTNEHLYKIKEAKNKKVGVITGAINNIRNIDIWVNSENTNMQMARFYEGSISGVIRYLGSQRDTLGHVSSDLIADNLKAKIENNLYVQPGTVIITDSGELENSHQVKQIYHVASVQGTIGSGYKPIPNISQCVSNVLNKIEENFEGKSASVLFPLLGTGTAKGELDEIIAGLFNSAISHLERNNDSKIEKVYFLAYTDVQLAKCTTLLDNNDQIDKA